MTVSEREETELVSRFILRGREVVVEEVSHEDNDSILQTKSQRELNTEKGAMLRGVRRELGLSLGQVSRILGISTSCWSNIERGKTTMYDGFPRHVIMTLVANIKDCEDVDGCFE